MNLTIDYRENGDTFVLVHSAPHIMAAVFPQGSRTVVLDDDLDDLKSKIRISVNYYLQHLLHLVRSAQALCAGGKQNTISGEQKACSRSNSRLFNISKNSCIRILTSDELIRYVISQRDECIMVWKLTWIDHCGLTDSITAPGFVNMAAEDKIRLESLDKGPHGITANMLSEKGFIDFRVRRRWVGYEYMPSRVSDFFIVHEDFFDLVIFQFLWSVKRRWITACQTVTCNGTERFYIVMQIYITGRQHGINTRVITIPRYGKNMRVMLSNFREYALGILC